MMKKHIIILSLFFPFVLFSQNYKLLNANSKKLFQTVSTPAVAHSMSIESSENINNDSVYYNYFTVSNDYFEDDSCEFWGSGCYKQNQASWLGKKIIFDNQDRYKFINLNNDTLDFWFTTIVDGPISFYSDDQQEFSILYEKDDTITLLGMQDSARRFRVIHLDSNGDTINSALNNFEIIISKQFGLSSFFKIDSFPEVLSPVEIIGNKSPDAGLFNLTNEMVFDHQAGDEIQFTEYYYNYFNPPWENYLRYRKWIFLERTTTEDSLIYSIRQELFYEDSTDIYTDTISVSYYKSGVISSIPFEKFDGKQRNFYIDDYCGLNMWTYKTFEIEADEYCESDTCWGITDLGRPPEQRTKKFVCGLGKYLDESYVVGPDGYSYDNNITYFIKDGTECGAQVIVGINNHEISTSEVVLSPNPATNIVTIRSPLKIINYSIINSSGQIIMNNTSDNKVVKINFETQHRGLYFVKVYLENGQTVLKKALVIN